MSHLDTIKEDVSTPFSKSRFALRREPVCVERMNVITGLPRCLDMPVKLVNTGLHMGRDYERLTDVVMAAIAMEDAILPSWRDTHNVYITYDCREVFAGRTHRRGGWHIDGMQGERYPEKLPVCHQYIMSDGCPTEYARGPFTAPDSYDVNWFEELGAQVDEDDVMTGEVNSLMLMSAYQLHRSPVIREYGVRTLIRVEFSMKRFDRAGNTVNAELPYDWDCVPRDIPAFKA